MFAYPARFTPEPEGGFTVTFRDVPEAITWDETRDKAARMAVDALETALSDYVDGRHPLPSPSVPEDGEVAISLSPLGTAKVGLYRAMQTQGVGKAELARRLQCHLPQVDRLLDLTHRSKLEQLELALAAVGKRLTVDVADAA